MSYVLKISKPGYNVLTAQNKDLSFSSELATHSVYQTLTVNKPSGTDHVIINHNLGFAPKVWVYLIEGDHYRRIPIVEYLNEHDYYITSTQIYIYGRSSISASYRVIIFTREI